jgi:ferredoxin-type protein NapH
MINQPSATRAIPHQFLSRMNTRALHPPRRQQLRRVAILLSMLLFPVILNYFSPYLIIDAASHGIINGSLILFALQFLSSLFFGRLWCAWGCPGAGLQEMLFEVNGKPARNKRLDWIKWAIWIPWISLIAIMALRAGGYRTIDFFYMTTNGLSVTAPLNYIIYYIVVGTFVILSLWLGRRAGCHAICWMSPFMILGRSLRNHFSWPSLRLEADPAQCTGCHHCTMNCPMSLPVEEMVSHNALEHHECILCGNCIDSCASKAIHYTFSSGGRNHPKATLHPQNF